MVSIRRRKCKGRCNGRSSLLVSLRSIPVGKVPENPSQSCRPGNVHHVPENPGQSCRPANVHQVPSLPSNQQIEVEEKKDLIASPPAKRQKAQAKIDPENPLEVHAYLMKLKEDKKLELGPLRRTEPMSVKEWMEKTYPYIFSVFPQCPKMFLQSADNSKQNEFLYSNYWLFLFEVRNIALMDYHVSPEYVESLGKIIKTLEMQGFDCRFMRSELLVKGYMMKKQQEIMLAERDVIAKRTANLQNELQNLARKKEKAELNHRGKEIDELPPDIEMLPKQMNNLQDDKHGGGGEPDKLLFSSLKEEYIQVILGRHKKLLACKEEEGKRLDQVLDKINKMHQNKAAFSYS